MFCFFIRFTNVVKTKKIMLRSRSYYPIIIKDLYTFTVFTRIFSLQKKNSQ